ncbi:MFS transporter [Citricoccus sp. GCM10030269]
MGQRAPRGAGPQAPSCRTGRRLLGHRGALAVYALIAVAFMASSSAPTPLYAEYQETLGLSPVVMTLVFATYPVILMLALLTTGSLSDFLGRRTVVAGAIAMQLVALVVFMVADSAPTLIVARALQGAATGIATTAYASALVDLHPARGPMINGLVPLVGMAIGGLGSGLISTATSAPAIAVFTCLLVMFCLLLAALVSVPETVTRRPGALTSLAPRISIPASARPMVQATAPVLVAVWAVGGFVLSLGPNLARDLTGDSSPLLGGWFVFALTGTGAVAVLLVMRLSPNFAFISGTLALAVGLGLIITATLTHAAWLVFLGASVAGYGFGVGFQGVLRTVVPIAAPVERAGLLSGVYIICYLSNALPSLGAGIVATTMGLHASVAVLGSTAIALALIGLIATLRTAAARQRAPVSGPELSSGTAP